MFLEDLKLVANNKASIVVLDSKGDLIDTIKNLAVFAPGNVLYGKLVLIELQRQIIDVLDVIARRPRFEHLVDRHAEMRARQARA